MKVLVLHQHFKVPARGGAIRSYYLSKALVERGVKTVVITTHNGNGYQQECIEGIEVHYLPVAYDNRFGFVRRVYAFIRFMQMAVTFARHHADADLCYAISTPLLTGLAASRIRGKLGIPYLFEVGDLWPDAPIEMGFIRCRFLQRYLYRMESRIYRNAEGIVALSPTIREVILKKTQEKAVHLIPNMSDTEFYVPGEKSAALEEKYGVKGRFVVSYLGAAGMANGLHYFIDCAAACERSGLSVHFQLCGDGAMLPVLKSYAAALGLRNFSFIPFQNRQGVQEIMNVTDANFICYQPFTILETGSPNKYFDGLAAGKLTVVNFNGWVREEIDRERCGVYADVRNPETFVTVIRPFVEDAFLLKKYQHAGRALAERKYSRKLLSDRFVTTVKSAAACNE